MLRQSNTLAGLDVMNEVQSSFLKGRQTLWHRLAALSDPLDDSYYKLVHNPLPKNLQCISAMQKQRF